MYKLNRKKLILLGGYLTFNLLAAIIGMRVLARVGSTLGSMNFSLGEVLNHLWAALLPSPF